MRHGCVSVLLAWCVACAASVVRNYVERAIDDAPRRPSSPDPFLRPPPRAPFRPSPRAASGLTFFFRPDANGVAYSVRPHLPPKGDPRAERSRLVTVFNATTADPARTTTSASSARRPRRASVVLGQRASSVRLRTHDTLHDRRVRRGGPSNAFKHPVHCGDCQIAL